MAQHELEQQELNIRPETLNAFVDGWIAPTGDEIREVMKLAGLTGSAFGSLVGVNSRTVRKWTGEEREIPFAAWRLLCVYCKIVTLV